MTRNDNKDTKCKRLATESLSRKIGILKSFQGQDQNPSNLQHLVPLKLNCVYRANSFLHVPSDLS